MLFELFWDIVSDWWQKSLAKAYEVQLESEHSSNSIQQQCGARIALLWQTAHQKRDQAKARLRQRYPDRDLAKALMQEHNTLLLRRKRCIDLLSNLSAMRLQQQNAALTVDVFRALCKTKDALQLHNAELAGAEEMLEDLGEQQQMAQELDELLTRDLSHLSGGISTDDAKLDQQVQELQKDQSVHDDFAPVHDPRVPLTRQRPHTLEAIELADSDDQLRFDAEQETNHLLYPNGQVTDFV